MTNIFCPLFIWNSSKGAEIKKGQYGDYIAYPETIIKELG